MADKPQQADDPTGTFLANPGFLLSHLGRRARRAFADGLRAWHLQPPHYGVLVALERSDGQTQQALSDLAGVGRSEMVDLIDTLERGGLVVRTRDRHDRRRYAIRLTDAGHTAAGEIDRLAVELNDRFFAPLDVTERDQLQRLLVKLFRSGPPRVAGSPPQK